MRSVCSELGAVAGAILEEVARRHPTFTDGAFARRLGVDRSLVVHWRAGSRPMPVEVLPHLAAYVRDPDAVYGDLLARADAHLVRDGAEAARPEEAIRQVRALVGRLLTDPWEEAVDEGPGGGEVAPEEAAPLMDLVDQALEDLRTLRAGLEERRVAPVKLRARGGRR